jgi:hypothetical protein
MIQIALIVDEGVRGDDPKAENGSKEPGRRNAPGSKKTALFDIVNRE